MSYFKLSVDKHKQYYSLASHKIFLLFFRAANNQNILIHAGKHTINYITLVNTRSGVGIKMIFYTNKIILVFTLPHRFGCYTNTPNQFSSWISEPHITQIVSYCPSMPSRPSIEKLRKMRVSCTFRRNRAISSNFLTGS